MPHPTIPASGWWRCALHRQRFDAAAEPCWLCVRLIASQPDALGWSLFRLAVNQWREDEL